MQSITSRLAILLMFFMVNACKKEASITTDEAIIVNIRYACGQACDASVFSLKIGEKYFVSSERLQDMYRQHNLLVTVSYQKTGRFPALWEGPTNAEIIEIRRIQKR